MKMYKKFMKICRKLKNLQKMHEHLLKTNENLSINPKGDGIGYFCGVGLLYSLFSDSI